ncbi:MAG: phosphopantetheine-binding protein [Gemmataceae bacterium]
MQDRQQIRATLIEMLEADTGESYKDIKEEDNIREGLGLDSVDVVSVVSQIERKLQMRLSHEELLKIVTVGDLLDLIESKVQAQSKAA